MLRATVALWVLTLPAIWAQSAQFEVASIRQHDPPFSRIDVSTSGKTLSAEASTALLVAFAYSLKSYQLSFGQTNSQVPYTFYDIVAKAPGDAVPTQDQFRQMLQALLAERFKLKAHRETRETEIYALVVGKNGPKLKPSAPDASPTGYMHVEGRNYHATRARATMDDVVQAIANSFLDRPVVDKTGLTGTYALDLIFTPDIRSNRGEPGPNDISIFTAVQEQLGLKLEPRKEPMEMLIVDSVEKPSDN